MIILTTLFCILVQFTEAAGKIASLTSRNIDSIKVSIQKADSCQDIADYPCVVELLTPFIQGEQIVEDSKLYAQILNQLGNSRYALGHFKMATSYFVEAYNIAKEINDIRNMALAQKGLAHITWRDGDNVNAISKIYESISFFKILKDTTEIIAASNILSGIYVSDQMFEEARNTYEEMLHLAIGSKDSASIASNLEYLGIVAFFEQKYDSAIHYYQKSYEVNQQLGKRIESAINQINMAESYVALQEYQQALDLLKQGIETLEFFKINSPLIFAYYTKADALSKNEQYKDAEYFFAKCLKLIDQVGESRERYNVLELMAAHYARQSDYRKAYLTHQKYAAAKDSIFNLEKDKQLQDIRASYEFESQAKENQYLNQENIRKQIEISLRNQQINKLYMLGAVLILLLAISIYLAYKLYINRKILANANTTKDRLFSIIAHDLRGPIGNISTLAGFIQNDLNEKERKEMTNMLKNTSETVHVLLQDLLSWSFSQKGGFQLKPEKLNLNEIVQKCINLLTYQAEFKGIEIENNIAAGLIIDADENALSIICRNILTNAIKFSKSGDKIQFAAQIRHDNGIDKLQLIIKDQGRGMSPDRLKNIMQGVKVKSEKGTSNEVGSGLGLSLVLAFVHEMHGEIQITSEEGTGSSFIIELPYV